MKGGLVVCWAAVALVCGAAAQGSGPSQDSSVPIGSAAHPVQRTDRNSLLAHEQLVRKAKQGRIDVYFVGDSITRRWGATDPRYRPLLENWKTNFFGWNAADFGWGGDRIENILWRLENGELTGVHPKVFVVMAGINNVGSQPADAAKIQDLVGGIEAIIKTCHAQAPNATIILMALFPRNDNLAVMPTINQINREIARLAHGEHVRYLDLTDRLADREGRALPGILNSDQLHPTLKAYQIWAEALKPLLTELLGPPARTDQAPPATGDPSVTR